MREPDRGLVDGTAKPTSPPPNFSAFLKEMWRKKALFFVIVGGGMVGLASTSVSNFMPMFLQRVHKMDVRHDEPVLRPDLGRIARYRADCRILRRRLAGKPGRRPLARLGRRLRPCPRADHLLVRVDDAEHQPSRRFSSSWLAR